MREQETKATFVTFYSFKGGVGRSMALINTAAILAGQQGFRVLVIDVDLEAPGLSYLDPAAPEDPGAQAQRELPLVNGFVDLLSDAKLRGQEADLFTLSGEALAERYSRLIHIPSVAREGSDGSLRVMPAGRLDATYGTRLNALNIGQLYADGIGEPLVRAFKKIIAESGLYDYVLVDSRTGLSEEAGMCTRELADHLMVVSGLNRQNVEGTSEFLRAFREATDGKKAVQIILSPVPNGEDELFQKREDAARSAFETAWQAGIDLSLQIPYHPQLALTEEPHIFRRRKGYLFESYRTIESSLLRCLGHTSDVFYRQAVESLHKRQYTAVLGILRHMVRLEGGRSMLTRIAEMFMRDVQIGPDGKRTGGKAVTVERLLKDSGGLAILKFLVTEFPVMEDDLAGERLAMTLDTLAPELADDLFRRITDALPDNADHLYNYAYFLTSRRGDIDQAEQFFLRTLEVDPDEAFFLRNYANFLADRRGDFDQAEQFYRRALETDSADEATYNQFANFLTHRRSDFSQAEQFYRRALESDPEDAPTLGDYGQALVADGRIAEGEAKLVAGFNLESRQEKANRAEFCFALWLVARMQERDGKVWVRRFKSFIDEGFQRHPWNFDQMLEKARHILTPHEFAYAQALAAAFLDEKKVLDLNSFPEWVALDAPPRESHKAQRKRRKAPP